MCVTISMLLGTLQTVKTHMKGSAPFAKIKHGLVGTEIDHFIKKIDRQPL